MKTINTTQMACFSGGKDKMGEFKKGLCEGAGFAFAALGFFDLGVGSAIRIGMATAGLAEYIVC